MATPRPWISIAQPSSRLECCISFQPGFLISTGFLALRKKIVNLGAVASGEKSSAQVEDRHDQDQARRARIPQEILLTERTAAEPSPGSKRGKKSSFAVFVFLNFQFVLPTGRVLRGVVDEESDLVS